MTYYKFINGIPEYRFEFNSDFDKKDYGYVNYENDDNTQIPKNLLFIWIGKTQPNWMKNAIEAYSKVNPDFTIVVEHIEDLSNTTNRYVLELQDILNSTDKKWQFFKKFYSNSFSKMLLSSAKSIDHDIIFSDLLRFYILNKIGGIYVDTDTFPNKPFDSSILKKNFFVKYYNINCNSMWDDIFFFGMKPNTICIDDYPAYDVENNDMSIYHIFRSSYFNNNYVRNKVLFKKENADLFEKFYAAKLEYDEKLFGHTSYLMHFTARAWSVDLYPIEQRQNFFYE